MSREQSPSQRSRNVRSGNRVAENRPRSKQSYRKRRELRKMERIVRGARSHAHSILLGAGWNPGDPDVMVKTIGFTSSSSGAGASTIAAQTAMTAAIASDAKVLLVDGNRSAPGVHRLFRVPNEPGLSSAIRDGFAVSAAIRSTGHGKLFVMPAGDKVLESQEFPQAYSGLFKSLAADFQLVVVDMPTVNQGSAMMSWARHLDAVMLVISSGSASTEDANTAANALKSNGVRQLSVVLNRYRPDLLERMYRRL